MEDNVNNENPNNNRSSSQDSHDTIHRSTGLDGHESNEFKKLKSKNSQNIPTLTSEESKKLNELSAKSLSYKGQSQDYINQSSFNQKGSQSVPANQINFQLVESANIYAQNQRQQPDADEDEKDGPPISYQNTNQRNNRFQQRQSPSRSETLKIIPDRNKTPKVSCFNINQLLQQQKHRLSSRDSIEEQKKAIKVKDIIINNNKTQQQQRQQPDADEDEKDGPPISYQNTNQRNNRFQQRQSPSSQSSSRSKTLKIIPKKKVEDFNLDFK